MAVRRESGFTLAETIVAAACGFLLLAALVSTARSMAGWGTRFSQRVNDQAVLDRLTDRWYADAATAWAVFTPPADVFGAPNVDGHEFDIATEDAQHRASYIAYYYAASQKILREYMYGAPGAVPTATGATSAGVTAFAAATYNAASLSDASSPAYDPLFAGSAIMNANVVLPLGVSAVGGNRLTRVQIGTKTENRTAMLSSATAPSSVTVVLTYTPPP